jgi:hypothetical protein
MTFINNRRKSDFNLSALYSYDRVIYVHGKLMPFDPASDFLRFGFVVNHTLQRYLTEQKKRTVPSPCRTGKWGKL